MSTQPTPVVDRERSAAQARIAASNARGLSHVKIGDRAFSDYFAALKRLGERFPGETSKELLSACVDVLQTSEITVNIVAPSFFSNPVTDEWYGNCWTRGMGSNKRDKTEKSMFDYASTSLPSVKSVFGKNAPSDAKARLQTVVDEVRDAGDDKAAAGFLGGMRPKYGALNFTGYPHGAAASTTYGMSYMKLVDVVRFNATYTAGDSFGLPTGAQAAKQLGSFMNFYPVVTNMDDAMLGALVAATKPDYKKGQGLPMDKHGNPSYVEAQLHMDINFGRELSRLVISKGELGSIADAKKKKAVQKNIEAFIKRFKVVLDYV